MSTNYEITITGFDWGSCYLQKMHNRRMQIVEDLQKEMDNLGIIAVIGDQFVIEIADHSMAFEMFKIVDVCHKCHTVEMIYTGGAS